MNKDAKGYLTPPQVKRIAQLGHSIGVHGKSHVWWTSMEQKKLIEDLREAKHSFEDLIGREVWGCSAPGGKINAETIKVIKESNLFKFIRNSKPMLNSIDHDTVINRVAVDQFDDLKSFQKKLEGDKFFMKKWLFSLIMMFTASVVTMQAQTYCTTGLYTSGCQYGDNLNDVTIGTLVQTATGCTGTGYADYTTDTISVAQTEPTTLSVTSGYSSQWYALYVDGNDDGDFADAGEFLWNSTVASGNVGTVTTDSETWIQTYFFTEH